MSWCTIESDPGVFGELIAKLGVKEVGVEEVYTLDSLIESQVQTPDLQYGLIFLFKWKKEDDNRATIPFDESAMENTVYFARQVIQDACATQALISILMNAPISLGEQLQEFKAFTACLDYESRGYAIGNSELLRDVHNSFARPEPFLHEPDAKSSKKGDAYHFIAYVPYNGIVYELDGLKNGPIVVGDYIQGDSSKHWLAAVKPVIEQRIAKYEQSETHFALLSVGKSVSAIIEEKIHSLEANELSLSTEEQVALVDYRQLLQEALEKKEKQRVENIRRRHNYIPFILELLTQMAAVRQGDFLAQCSSNAKKTVTVKQKNFA